MKHFVALLLIGIACFTTGARRRYVPPVVAAGGGGTATFDAVSACGCWGISTQTNGSAATWTMTSDWWGVVGVELKHD